MLTSLDLLVIVFMVMASLSLLSLLLMFLMKHKVVRRISLFVATALGIYTSVVGIVFFGSYFIGQAVVAVIVGLASVGAIVLNIMSARFKKDKLELISRITAAAALIVGIVNIFLI